LGGFEEILRLAVGHVASGGGNIALAACLYWSQAGFPTLQPGFVARLLQDVCNTMIYITFDVPVDPERAAVILLQPPFTQSCQRVLGVGGHEVILSQSDNTSKKPRAMAGQSFLVVAGILKHVGIDPVLFARS
jgi:hypothetical protein